MALTPGGLPYPVGTDLVRDGDNAIEALARAVEARIWAAGLAPNVRHFQGTYSTGSDGRVWVTVPGIASIVGAIGAVPGTNRWVARAYQYSTGSVLWEVHDVVNGNTINSTPLALAMTVWGT